MFNENLLLNGKTAIALYQDVAKNAPIYDFHCHLSAKDIYEDSQFSNISKLLLGFDHYKWRAMRYAGVPEQIVTGPTFENQTEAADLLRFRHWASTCQRLVGSPLYHWNSLELNKYFGIEVPLKEENAVQIYDQCNRIIKEQQLSPRKLIQASHVKLICTTDDPSDDLKYHLLLAKEALTFQVLPTFRPDKAMNLTATDYTDYLDKLSTASDKKINTFVDLLEALYQRIAFFVSAGCRLSDHSIEGLTSRCISMEQANELFQQRMKGDIISDEDALAFRLLMLKQLAVAYRKNGWVMQLHFGAMRNTNQLLHQKLGVDIGLDTMNDFLLAPQLASLLNAIHTESGLPKTILYTLNPKDNIVLSSLPHSFSEDGVPGKVQFGAAWWFNDHKSGIKQHLQAIADQSMLADFVGMLTDSRSFLSYARHDYFRRILCSFIGELVDSGEFENDSRLLTEIVQNICWKNIKNYLSLEESI